MNNKPEIPYHILMVVVGQMLNEDNSITVPALQHELSLSDSVGFNLPYSVCEDVLNLLELGNYIKKVGSQYIGGKNYYEYGKA